MKIAMHVASPRPREKAIKQTTRKEMFFHCAAKKIITLWMVLSSDGNFKIDIVCLNGDRFGLVAIEPNDARLLFANLIRLDCLAAIDDLEPTLPGQADLEPADENEGL